MKPTTVKSLITLATFVNAVTAFYLSPKLGTNKLDRLSTTSLKLTLKAVGAVVLHSGRL
jgi:hypothetical protein